jgi:molecular chaperone IbpA
MSKDYYDPFAFSKSLLPSSIGFDTLFKNLEAAQKQITKAALNYPPYNIKKVGENKYVLELAVAGFGKHDIELTLQDGTLTVKGSTTLDTLIKDGIDITYLHKGIADRAFTRQFSLADTVEIKNAELINGMLKVWLENIIPDSKKPRKIEINDNGGSLDQVEADSTKQFLSEYQK